jgi:hypothetical protein
MMTAEIIGPLDPPRCGRLAAGVPAVEPPSTAMEIREAVVGGHLRPDRPKSRSRGFSPGDGQAASKPASSTARRAAVTRSPWIRRSGEAGNSAISRRHRRSCGAALRRERQPRWVRPCPPTSCPGGHLLTSPGHQGVVVPAPGVTIEVQPLDENRRHEKKDRNRSSESRQGVVVVVAKAVIESGRRRREESPRAGRPPPAPGRPRAGRCGREPPSVERRRRAAR